MTQLLIPDNCKTATTANTRYETVLNRSYQELAEYYGTAIVPARVRKPQDKSAAEASVRFAETRIIPLMVIRFSITPLARTNMSPVYSPSVRFFLCPKSFK